jgi:hypothetical protein
MGILERDVGYCQHVILWVLKKFVPKKKMDQSICNRGLKGEEFCEKNGNKGMMKMVRE